jgi:hypothetical protein
MSESVTLYPLINPALKNAVGHPGKFVGRAWCARHNMPLAHNGFPFQGCEPEPKPRLVQEPQ